MIKGDHPPSKWEIVRNDQAIAMIPERWGESQRESEGPAFESVEVGELVAADAVVDRGELSGTEKQGGGKNKDFVVII